MNRPKRRLVLTIVSEGSKLSVKIILQSHCRTAFNPIHLAGESEYLFIHDEFGLYSNTTDPEIYPHSYKGALSIFAVNDLEITEGDQSRTVVYRFEEVTAMDYYKDRLIKAVNTYNERYRGSKNTVIV